MGETRGTEMARPPGPAGRTQVFLDLGKESLNILPWGATSSLNLAWTEGRRDPHYAQLRSLQQPDEALMAWHSSHAPRLNGPSPSGPRGSLQGEGQDRRLTGLLWSPPYPTRELIWPGPSLALQRLLLTAALAGSGCNCPTPSAHRVPPRGPLRRTRPVAPGRYGSASG